MKITTARNSTDVSMSYREVAPVAEVAHLIHSFWEFTVGGEFPATGSHEVFPDGCVYLLYYRNPNIPVNRLIIHGLTSTVFPIPVFAGDASWGVRLAPAACRNVLRCDPANITTEEAQNLEFLAHLHSELSNRLCDCSNFTEAIAVYENQFKSLELKSSDIDQKVAQAVCVVADSGGQVKIAEVAAQVGLSQRQLERRFRAASGLTPKQFARAWRVRATAINLQDNAAINWAERAAEMGFTDQAHLTHELGALTGRTPRGFAERMRQFAENKPI